MRSGAARGAERKETARGASTLRQGETKRGKGRRTREGERGKNGGEKQGERDDFTMRGGGGNGSSTLVKISSKPTKGKVRPSSLQTSPRTFNFSLENPGFPPFLFPVLLLRRASSRSSLPTLCRSFVSTTNGTLKSASSMITPRD